MVSKTGWAGQAPVCTCALPGVPSTVALTLSLPCVWVDNTALWCRPSFESATGWHLESKYDKMSLEIRASLEAFYRPHNKRLAAYLGHSLGWGEEDKEEKRKPTWVG